jgi:hypothetical protein
MPGQIRKIFGCTSSKQFISAKHEQFYRRISPYYAPQMTLIEAYRYSAIILTALSSAFVTVSSPHIYIILLVDITFIFII